MAQNDRATDNGGNGQGDGMTRKGLGLWVKAPQPVASAEMFGENVEPWFWADVPPAVLWQDVARTTPVTAAGQPVGTVDAPGFNIRARFAKLGDW